uniref:ABC-type xenobiotic transporter n=1 Tax=Esox lucius TaxID=8010 RepID=A0A6Q2ZJP2_ESOLU
MGVGEGELPGHLAPIPEEAFQRGYPNLAFDDDEKPPEETKEEPQTADIEAKTAKGRRKKKTEPKEPQRTVGFFQLFRYATCCEVFLMVIGLLCSAIHGIALPLMCVVFGDMTDNFVQSGQQYFTNLTSILIYIFSYRNAYYFVGIGCAVLLLGTFQVMLFLLTATKQTKRIREKYFHAILHQQMAWFDTHQIGVLNVRMTDDINTINEGLGDKICVFVQFFCTFLTGLIIGFVFGWKLTLVILAISPLLAGSAAILATLTSKELSAYAKAGAVAEEILVAIRTVVAFNGQKKAVEKYENNLEDAKNYGIKKAITTNVSMGLTQFVIFGAYALAFWYGTKLSVDEPENYTIGKTITVFFSVMIGAFSLGQGAPNLEAIAKARGAAYEVYKTIDQPRPIDSSSKEGHKPDHVRGDIEFKDIHFNYPSRKEVKGVNLTVPRGKTIALVGASGCGKSTTIQLLQRFYDPDLGQITLDGHDIRTLNVKWLRENIGIVSQEPVLFGTTIAENIRYGKADATDEDIERAVKEANAYDFIAKLPDKLNTMVGERGAQLSGGQKQRIAIARALVKNPKILLLDEATSALDTQSESIVQAALDKARAGRTTIMIAHRLSTIRTADVIAGFSNGQVVEQGTHRELMAKKGVYYSLVMQQSHGNPEVEDTSEDNSLPDYNDLAQVLLYHVHTVFVMQFSFLIDNGSLQKEDESNLPDVPLSRILAMNKPEWPYLLFGVLASLVGGGVYPCVAILFAKIIGVSDSHLEIGWFDDHENAVGVLTTRLASDASLVKGATGARLGLLTNCICTLTIAIVVAFVFCWQLTLLILACVPFLIGANFIQMRAMAGHASKDQGALEQSGKTVENFKTVVALTREDVFFYKFMDSLERPYKNGLVKAPIYGLTFALSQAIPYMVNAAIFRFGAWLIAHCYTYLIRVTRQSSSFAPDFGKAKTAAARIIKLLEKDPEIDIYSEEGKKPSDFAGNIEFRGIHFAYPTRQNVKVLQGLNVSVGPGQTLALVGESGCGKSTSVQLLERFYNPAEGQVLVDGQDAKTLNLAWLRSQLGLVSQEPILFDCTITENIQYGDNSRVVSQAEIEEAAKKANIHDFIMGLPEKYNTSVGDKGTQMSGGQKQRIAIARALVRQPKILLLDEATSALDTESEKIVQQALDDARLGRTCIVIAHRLSTIHNADKIAVIQNGQVAEQGTHTELMAKEGAYFALVNAQVNH